MAEITQLVCYPVKGCAGITLRGGFLTHAGLRHDRSLMITDAHGGFRSQRNTPRMAVLTPEIDEEGTRLTLHAPGTEPLVVTTTDSGRRETVELHRANYLGVDQGDRAAEWLSEVLGGPCRLVRVPTEHDRVTDGLTPGTSAYADSCPVLVTSRASLDELNERLTARGHPPLPMDRFRPNVVVDGWEHPHTEDLARSVTAGEAALGYAKIAKRCAVTTVEQSSGHKNGPEPLRTLAEYRRTGHNGVAFGSKFAVTRPGRISVGDPFRVTEWGESEL
ncbi:MOSC domain-containing protein [Actinopolyspora mortivallis]|uniref:MOSC domain-containing protein n=1 Tax=Actinopolyspora mortivallis TaxID=33906 RepID=UPI00036786FF|nr:MOSC N-terminal beta barrel domain-containing protein [Actinopolyspora mortivallis]